MQEIQLMWSLGPAEMVLIVVVALFIFGPKRLPELGQSLGETLRSFRSASNSEPKRLNPEAAETRDS